MKNIELRKVPCGETFTAFGEEYVVLDHMAHCAFYEPIEEPEGDEGV